MVEGVKYFGLYPKCKGKPLKSLKQENDMIDLQDEKITVAPVQGTDWQGTRLDARRPSKRKVVEMSDDERGLEQQAVLWMESNSQIQTGSYQQGEG